jgi:membrane associated rhomboid family serine protease
MIVPYGDNLTKGRAFIGVSLLIAAMFCLDLPSFLDSALRAWSIRDFGFVPIYFSVDPWPHAHTLLTSEFIHADIFHLAGNCLFLWVFGRSLERLFGAVSLLTVFPLLGIVGLLAHWAIYPNSYVPVIGASGAIATLMGAYLALFPGARMRMIFFFGLGFKRFQTPAWMFLVYWSVLQLLSLLVGSGTNDQVAFAVHVGGFAIGVLIAMYWKVSYPFAEERLSAFMISSFAIDRA